MMAFFVKIVNGFKLLTILKKHFMICSANKWTGFYMIVTYVMKELNTSLQSMAPAVLLISHRRFVFLVNVTSDALQQYQNF